MKHISSHGTSATSPARQGRTGFCILFARVDRDRCTSPPVQTCGILSKDVFSRPLLMQVKALAFVLWDQPINQIAGVVR